MYKHKIKVYLPTKDNKGRRIGNRQRAEVKGRIVKAFMDSHGGCSEYDGYGHYTTLKGEHIAEKITFIEAFSEHEIDEESVTALATGLKNTLRQESVAIEIDGTMRFW